MAGSSIGEKFFGGDKAKCRENMLALDRVATFKATPDFLTRKATVGAKSAPAGEKTSFDTRLMLDLAEITTVVVPIARRSHSPGAQCR